MYHQQLHLLARSLASQSMTLATKANAVTSSALKHVIAVKKSSKPNADSVTLKNSVNSAELNGALGGDHSVIVHTVTAAGNSTPSAKCLLADRLYISLRPTSIPWSRYSPVPTLFFVLIKKRLR